MRRGSLNERQEKYAQNLASGMSQVDASIASGYSNSESRASRLANDDRVISRVKQIQMAAAKRVEIDKAWVMIELKKNHEMAQACGDLSASNKALELLGKELGMFREKVDVDVTLNRRLIVERLTDEMADQLTTIVRTIEDGTDEHRV